MLTLLGGPTGMHSEPSQHGGGSSPMKKMAEPGTTQHRHSAGPLTSPQRTSGIGGHPPGALGSHSSGNSTTPLPHTPGTVVLVLDVLVVDVLVVAGQATSAEAPTIRQTFASSRRTVPPAAPPSALQYRSPPATSSTKRPVAPGFGGTTSSCCVPRLPRRETLSSAVPFARRWSTTLRTGSPSTPVGPTYR